jgi:PemK-like, MazF-like toxin of type II toxin-antitoxin system
MPSFKPEIGLVIRHAYLWWNEARAGREEGLKDRPCLIVHRLKNEQGEFDVYIAPITHTAPRARERALEMPIATKSRLGLDARPSWIITSEVNRFIWPGPDIRVVPGGRTAYGLLPAAMTRDVIRQIKINAQDQTLLVVGREYEALSEASRRRKASPKGKGSGRGR